MSTPKAPRGSAAAPLLHWLLVLGGLALLTWLRPDDDDKLAPLWLSVLLATALGQLFGHLRLRLWLVIFLVFNGMWLFPLAMVHVLQQLANPWPAVEIFLLAFGPGTVCAYLSMSERGGLLAFWFPAVLWMLSILDRSDDTALSGPLSWVLLTTLAALMLAFFRLQEARRIAVWQGHATARLAEVRPPVILRRTPLRHVAQLAWIVSLAAATLGLTAWIAPHLWQKEQIPADHAAPLAAGAAGIDEGSGERCCTAESFEEEAPKSRVREYFSLLRPHESAVPSAPTACLACVDSVPVQGHGAGTGVAVAGPGNAHAGAIAAQPGAAATPPAGGTPLAAADPLAPVVPPPAQLAPVPPAPPRPAAPRPAVASSRRRSPVVVARPAGVSGSSGPWQGAVVVVAPGEPASGIDPVAWLLTFALCASGVQLASRPLRRLLALRHLRRPFWPETVDQRVSNLWQLMLVGLRDAGFRAAPGEQPQELARRIDLEGMSTCAMVLERARHGVRVDAADLKAMEQAAASVYQAARQRAGLPARAAAMLRWPLV